MSDRQDDLLNRNIKECKICHKPLPMAYQGELCPSCEEQNLFAQVRDFIRANNVNEYQVAEQFNIPVRVVKSWIKEGRIEYKQVGENTLAGVRCQRCGAPVSFGTLCPKCLKLMNGAHGYGVSTPASSADNRMRFVNNPDNKK